MECQISTLGDQCRTVEVIVELAINSVFGTAVQVELRRAAVVVEFAVSEEAECARPIDFHRIETSDAVDTAV